MEEAKQELTIVHDIPPATSLNSICPILIGVAGGSASGKTTLCNTIISEIGESECLIISLDSFYKPLTEEEAIGFNFDHPDALDFDLCYEVIKKLLTRQPAEVPIYNFHTNTREKETQRVEPTDIILLEGILALYNPKLVSLMNIKLFVDCDNDIRLYRRTLRDIKERGRDVTSILYAYNKFVKPAFDELIKPTMNHANLIIPGRGENAVAIRFIVQNMKMQLARVKEMKKLMNNNAYYADILDSCWVNIKNNQEDSEELRLRQLDNITFLMDQNARVECLRILDVFDNPFSDTLYVVLMVKYLQHGLDLMKNHKAAKAKKFRLVYYIDGVFDREDHLTSAPVIAVIVPFLYEATFASTQQKLNQISKMNPGSKIFVISIFSDLDSLTNLSHGKEKAFMINILCIVDMKALLVRLEKNCEASGVDFLNHKLLAKVMIETGELQKDEPETESDLTKKVE